MASEATIAGGTAFETDMQNNVLGTKQRDMFH
jgi:hypothetical protein